MTRTARFTLVGVVLALLLLGVLRFTPDAHLLRAGQPFPPLTFVTLEGQALDSGRLRGRVLVLNVWATWCAPCIAELPALARLQAQLGAGASVIALAVDQDVADVRRFVAEHQPGLTVAFDPGGARTLPPLGVEALPVTYVVAPDGRVHEAYLGARAWDAPDVLRRLRALSTSPSTAPTR